MRVEENFILALDVNKKEILYKWLSPMETKRV
jgi:hypothetical protein